MRPRSRPDDPLLLGIGIAVLGSVAAMLLRLIIR
jgi:hypothetical protein